MQIKQRDDLLWYFFSLTINLFLLSEDSELLADI